MTLNYFSNSNIRVNSMGGKSYNEVSHNYKEGEGSSPCAEMERYSGYIVYAVYNKNWLDQ